jgi:hypothetical protein
MAPPDAVTRVVDHGVALLRVVGAVLVAGAMTSAAGMAAPTPPGGLRDAATSSAEARTQRAVAYAKARKTNVLSTRAGIRRARRFARSRKGVIAFAVLDTEHRPRGLHRTARFPSASVSKAMLLVAALRRAAGRRLSDTTRRFLRSMITVSDNDAASAIYAQVGGEGLRRVARAAGMRKFTDVGHWAGARITAADQARLFLRIDKLVPAAHRRYARKLLSSIVTSQRWGIARAARREHMKVFFKGGWRDGITHQVALLERGGRRLALAVLTGASPSMAYAEETIERIASRVLG